MITAKLQGRRLILTVEGDPGDPAIEPFVVEPLPARLGRELSGRYIFAIEGLPPMYPDAPTVADDMIAAFGRENYERADNELQISELEVVAQAAYFWQSLGGMDAVTELLSPDDDGKQGGPVGRGKALAVFRFRVAPLLQQILQSLESEHRTRTADTPATTTRSGGGKNAGSSSSKPPAGASFKRPANSPRRPSPSSASSTATSG